MPKKPREEFRRVIDNPYMQGTLAPSTQRCCDDAHACNLRLRSALTLSLEGGYPFALTSDWTLEPQVQLIWNRTWLNETSDAFSTVSFDGNDTLTGRLGARLQGTFDTSAGQFQPYVKANLWHTFDSEQAILFGSDAIVTQMEGTSLELGGGIVAKLSEAVSLHVTGDYTTNLGGEKQRIFEGNVGLTLKW